MNTTINMPTATNELSAGYTITKAQAWGLALVTPLLGLAWVKILSGAFANASSSPAPWFATWVGFVILITAVTAWYTDARWQKLPNWLTYSAVLWGLGLHLVAALLPESAGWIGSVSLSSGLIGFAMLFVLFLIVFSFTGGGAGDVKMAGAVGMLFGLELGVEVMLNAFIAAGLVICVAILYRLGPLNAVRLLYRRVIALLTRQSAQSLTDEEKQLMKLPVALGPFFAVGMLIVLFGGGLL